MDRPLAIAEARRARAGEEGAHLRDDGERDLLRRLRAEVEADRRVETRTVEDPEIAEDARRALLRSEDADVRHVLAEEGRANDPFEIQGVVTDVADADGFRRLEDAGLTDMITMPWAFYGHGLGNAPLDKKIDGMKRFAEKVIARMSN